MDDEEIEAGALKLSKAYVRNTVFESNRQAIGQVMIETRTLLMKYINGRKANADAQKVKEETHAADIFFEDFRKIMTKLMVHIVDENDAQIKSGDSQRPPHIFFQTCQNDVAAAHAQLLNCEQEKKDLLLNWEQEKKGWEQDKENLMVALESVTKTNKSLRAESDKLIDGNDRSWYNRLMNENDQLREQVSFYKEEISFYSDCRRAQKRGGGGVSTEGKKRRNKNKSRRNKNKSKKRSNKNVKK